MGIHSSRKSFAGAGCSITSEYLHEWIRKAEEDFEAATALSRKCKRPTPNAVCFHCQQSAKKYLKVFLVKHNIPFQKTHDLMELHKLCAEVNPRFEIIVDWLDRLNPYSVAYRYPGEEVTQDEARKALKLANKVREFIQPTLSLVNLGTYGEIGWSRDELHER